jgi:hypothetical protein
MVEGEASPFRIDERPGNGTIERDRVGGQVVDRPHVADAHLDSSRYDPLWILAHSHHSGKTSGAFGSDS